MFARVPDGVAAREQGEGEERRLTRQTPKGVDRKTFKAGGVGSRRRPQRLLGQEVGAWSLCALIGLSPICSRIQ